MYLSAQTHTYAYVCICGIWFSAQIHTYSFGMPSSHHEQVHVWHIFIWVYLSFASIHIFVKYTLSTHGGTLDYNNRICGAVCGSHLCKRSVIGTKALTSNPGSRNSRHLHRYFGGRWIRIYICKHIWICQMYIYLVYLLLLNFHLFLGWEVKVVIIYGRTYTCAEKTSYTGVENSSYIKVHI